MAKSPADALAKEANAHLLRNEILPARYMLQQAYAKDVTNLKAWVQLGLLSLRARDVDRFLGEYGRSQATNDKLWIELAARSAEGGAWDEARTFLKYNATLSTSATLPQYTLAEIADALKQPDRADAYLQDAAKARPTDPEPWLRLADRAIAAKQNDKAAAALAEAEKRGASPSALEERRKKGVAPAAPTRPGIERSVIR
jgi:predicted Zn-dependent protease